MASSIGSSETLKQLSIEGRGGEGREVGLLGEIVILGDVISAKLERRVDKNMVGDQWRISRGCFPNNRLWK